MLNAVAIDDILAIPDVLTIPDILVIPGVPGIPNVLDIPDVLAIPEENGRWPLLESRYWSWRPSHGHSKPGIFYVLSFPQLACLCTEEIAQLHSH